MPDIVLTEADKELIAEMRLVMDEQGASLVELTEDALLEFKEDTPFIAMLREFDALAGKLFMILTHEEANA